MPVLKFIDHSKRALKFIELGSEVQNWKVSLESSACQFKVQN